MRKLLAILMLLVIIVILFIVYNNRNNVKIIKQKSFYSDFSVENDKVYIKYEICINNSTNKNKTVILKAIMNDDVKLGLLKNAVLVGYNSDLSSTEFIIEKGENVFLVNFVGDYGGTTKKHDRNLPSISIEILK